MCDCSDLIGRPYKLNATPTDQAIDCIQLVYEVHHRLGIKNPTFRQSWYTASFPTIARDLLHWGNRIDEPQYDGDVVLLPQDRAFGVTWQGGILYINGATQKVAWCPISALSVSPSCPTSASSLKCWAFRGKSTNNS